MTTADDRAARPKLTRTQRLAMEEIARSISGRLVFGAGFGRYRVALRPLATRPDYLISYFQRDNGDEEFGLTTAGRRAISAQEPTMIRVCPKRDARCPHGMECPYTIDRYSCKPEPEAMTTDRLMELAKALVWERRIGSSDTFDADTAFSRYTAGTNDSAEGFWQMPGLTPTYYFQSGLDAAKAAAQADYESRIRSAVSPALLIALDEARRALEPLAEAAEQMDRELPWARDGKITFVNPADGNDEPFATWPVPDDHLVIDAWRYHDPQPASEHMGIQMLHLRAAKSALAAINAIGRE